MYDNLELALNQIYDEHSMPEDTPLILKPKGYEQIQQIADVVVKAVKARGFKVMRYDSITTNSVYLKFDYGVANSLRISDHKGKKHLKYRFNISVTENEFRVGGSLDYPRYIYPSLQTFRFVKDLVNLKKNKIETWGEENYLRWMQRDKKQKGCVKGFWTQATEV